MENLVLFFQPNIKPILSSYCSLAGAVHFDYSYRMVTRLIPTQIQIIGNEIALKWNDEVESYLLFEKLRRACPCAGCGGEPDVMGYVNRPKVTYTPASFVMKSYQIIGGYAIQPVWQDGHSSGLYPFDFLRRLGESE